MHNVILAYGETDDEKVEDWEHGSVGDVNNGFEKNGQRRKG